MKKLNGVRLKHHKGTAQCQTAALPVPDLVTIPCKGRRRCKSRTENRRYRRIYVRSRSFKRIGNCQSGNRN